jgi:F-type H+-transporting ATPase subunit b
VDALGINLPGLLAQIVNFSVLLFLLYRFAYKPIVKLLDERAEKIRTSLDQAEKLRQESDEAQLAINARLDEARREGQAIVANANQVAERVRAEAEDAARREADVILTRARAEIASERDAALAQLRTQFADLTVLAAERIINRSLDKETHRELIERVLEESNARN